MSSLNNSCTRSSDVQTSWSLRALGRIYSSLNNLHEKAMKSYMRKRRISIRLIAEINKFFASFIYYVYIKCLTNQQITER